MSGDEALREGGDHDTGIVPASAARRAGWVTFLREKPEWVCVPLLFLLVTGGWEWAFRFYAVPLYIAPAPSNIWRSLVGGLASGLFLDNAIYTLTEAMLGFVCAAIAALVLGGLIAQSRFIERTLYPYLIAIQTTPKVAIAPLFIIWFGFGMTSKAIMAGVVAFFPILVNVIAGLRSTDHARIELMRSLQASRWQTFTMVRLPSAAPMIFAGLHVAVIFSILGAIVGEFVGSRKGLGNLILQMNTNLDTAGVFAALVCLSAMGITLHALMQWLQRRILFWVDHHQIASV
jgi:NitT/TauT family transport system permease protein